MSWTVDARHFPSTGGHVVYHNYADTSLGMDVRHSPHNSIETHKVVLNAGLHNRAVMSWPSSQHGEKQAYLGYHGGENHYGPPPSERLRALIESHGTNHAWMPLLDALAEEYPEHFERPVAEHTRQRASIS